VRTLWQSGDCRRGRGISVGGDGGEVVDFGVRGGRNSGRVECVDPISLNVSLSEEVGKEREDSLEEELEEGSGDTMFDELSELSQHKELQDLELHHSKTVQLSLHGESREDGSADKVDTRVHIIIIESDGVVDKWGCLKLRVILNCKECDWTLKDSGIQVVGPREREMRKADRDNGGDGSHVQEGFGRQPKRRGLIYPGHDPEWIMPNWQWSVNRTGLWDSEEAAAERSDCCRKIWIAAQQLRGGIGVGNSRDKGRGTWRGVISQAQMIETTLLILRFGLLCMTALIVFGILSACRMTLDLQEQMAMWGTPL